MALKFEEKYSPFMELKKFALVGNKTDVLDRAYENSVIITYYINREEKTIGVSWVQAGDPGHGDGTKAFREFMNDFKDYTITLDSVLEAVSFYKRLGFVEDNRTAPQEELLPMIWRADK